MDKKCNSLKFMLRCLNYVITGRAVTANMPLLGRGDSGFESRRPDTVSFVNLVSKHLCLGTRASRHGIKEGKSKKQNGIKEILKPLIIL